MFESARHSGLGCSYYNMIPQSFLVGSSDIVPSAGERLTKDEQLKECVGESLLYRATVTDTGVGGSSKIQMSPFAISAARIFHDSDDTQSLTHSPAKLDVDSMFKNLKKTNVPLDRLSKQKSDFVRMCTRHVMEDLSQHLRGSDGFCAGMSFEEAIVMPRGTSVGPALLYKDEFQGEKLYFDCNVAIAKAINDGLIPNRTYKGKTAFLGDEGENYVGPLMDIEIFTAPTSWGINKLLSFRQAANEIINRLNAGDEGFDQLYS